jgi:hypothetical protein
MEVREMNKIGETNLLIKLEWWSSLAVEIVSLKAVFISYPFF